MKRIAYLLPLKSMLLAALIVLTACTPATFVQTMDPGWNAIEVREEMDFDTAWQTTVDTLARKFDIEILSKDDGYLRTGWLHSWTGKLDDSYRVRAIVKFSPDKRLLEVKSEAQRYRSGVVGIGDGWVMGTDERLTTTLRTDLMGKVGRIAR